MICGEKTTTQQAIETEPSIPLIASMSTFCAGEGNMLEIEAKLKEETFDDHWPWIQPNAVGAMDMIK